MARRVAEDPRRAPGTLAGVEVGTFLMGAGA